MLNDQQNNNAVSYEALGFIAGVFLVRFIAKILIKILHSNRSLGEETTQRDRIKQYLLTRGFPGDIEYTAKALEKKLKEKI